jgi:hypothetical protein
MGVKIAQLLASWHPASLEALILVARSPPVPMAAPEEQRKQMIEAYDTRQAVEVLIEHVLRAVRITEKVREMIIEDTLRGTPQGKREWPEAGMIEDISSAVLKINVPTLVLAGENDQVERVATLEQELIPRIRGAQIKVIPRSGHLSPLEVPDEIAAGIPNFIASLQVQNRGKTKMANEALLARRNFSKARDLKLSRTGCSISLLDCNTNFRHRYLVRNLTGDYRSNATFYCRRGQNGDTQLNRRVRSAWASLLQSGKLWE